MGFKIKYHGLINTPSGNYFKGSFTGVRKLFKKKKKPPTPNYSEMLGNYNKISSPLSSKASFYKSGFSAVSHKRNLSTLSI